MPTVLETRIENRFRVQPNHANNNETLHGGNLMKWLDEIGAMSAMRFSGETCVTARVNELEFERPIGIGDTAVVEAFVYDTGRTSVHVGLRAWRETPTTGEMERTTESSFTFVAIDEDGSPVAVPELTVDSERGRKLRERMLETEAES
ncbi:MULTISPECIES: acyl-CoA thioesterase [Natronorubrum]|uniref:Acyl-CoA hydrolase n=2 Tax=Natronorubrum TaxID=134813 RepID=A0A1N7FB49_9EURY|nr:MULTISPECIES: acyl-CoA thioesterase [Natronorubrum]APX97661.1 acyl-CoA thioesterase [Natronorubrum daqingense]SEH17656.1 Acyl-CoA hydrolase [Natronorubrum sediminis]SIR97502.1 Acyl-CoA hydrolase [Natronorubrum daqingense]